MRNKTKISIIAIGLLVLAGFVALAFSKIDGLQVNRKLTKSDYHVGAISVESGKIIESKQNFYSDLFEVEDAEIKINEDATASYKVFFYDEDGKYIESTASLTEDLSADSIPETAKYFRIVVTPALVDEEPVECSAFNVSRYVSQISVTVAK